MTVSIVIIFLFGYFLITMENSLKVNKTAIALLLSVTCWMLYMANCDAYVNLFHAADFQQWKSKLGVGAMGTAASYVINKIFVAHVGDTSEIIFFLLGAMTIVEVVDTNGGFDFVREKVKTKSQRALLWRITFMTFFISAVLDNLTTTIVMIMVLRKLVPQREIRLRYAGMIVLAANAGGAFSPIGDVTTIMLWIKGNISTLGVLKEIFLPAVACIVVPLLFVQHKLNGTVANVQGATGDKPINPYDFSRRQRHAVFYIGVVGLVLVPIFRSVTGLPPFMGIILVL
ncbi:MAG: sodium:proton antiporter NhaD, partial [Bacteroidaceae bacterium]